MRVVSLLPAATEVVAALGGEEHLVGISHECDWPPWITHLPRVTTTPVEADAASGAIDAQVRALRTEGRPVIGVDAARLAGLRPDVILTQDLCEVCAVGDGQVHRLAEVLSPAPKVVSLAARDLEGIFSDITLVARALDLTSEGEELNTGLHYRLRRLRQSAPPAHPRVLAIEWLDPVYLAGHWVPDQIEAAGGVDVGATAGAPSVTMARDRLAALRPDLVVVMLCGFGLERAARELMLAPLPPLNAPVWLLDGNAYTSRPGPRVVDGAERLQAAMLGRPMPGLRRVAPG